METFTEQELEYLRTQPLARFATASPSGVPDVAPVTFGVDDGYIVSAGFDITTTVRYRNIQRNPRAVIVVDDLAPGEGWSPRGIKVRGTATIEAHVDGVRFRITPEVVWSWGLNDAAGGIPRMDRRTIAHPQPEG